MDLTFGGNTANFGVTIPTRLDYFLLEEDVANLAMMSYKEGIRDYYFFNRAQAYGKLQNLVYDLTFSAMVCDYGNFQTINSFSGTF